MDKYILIIALSAVVPCGAASTVYPIAWECPGQRDKALFTLNWD